MKKIFSYLKPYRFRMIVGFLIKVLATIAELIIPMLLAYVINDIVPQQDVKLILYWGGIMLLFSVLAFLGNVTANRMASKVARNATEQIRYDLFHKIMYLSSKQLEELTTPSLISRATSDTYNLHQMFGMMQRLGVRAPIMLLGGIMLSFALDVTLTLVMVALLPIMTIIVYTISKKGIPMYTNVQEANDRFVRQMREVITGIRVIKALSKVSFEKEKFDAINKEVVTKDQKAGLFMSALNPIMSLLLNLGLVLIIFVGAYRVNNGTLEAATIVAFMSYVTMVLNSILFISRLFVMYSKAYASGKRIANVLEYNEEQCIVPSDEKEMDFIVFDQVSFGYDNETTVENISFSLKKGETLGIIGVTGSGKSTLIQLLMRFYDIKKGNIFVNGKNITSYPMNELRSMFGVVFQNDIIFKDSIYENISFGREIPKEQVIEAAKTAQSYEFIMERGLDFPLAIKGANLSGGQKQRLLITRALANNPSILILDDSSSALDYKTDARLRSEIRKHYKNTTTIMVAQRVSSIMNCNKIIVMDEGKMVGYGTHEELLKQCEIYREISHSQIGGEGNE